MGAANAGLHVVVMGGVHVIRPAVLSVRPAGAVVISELSADGEMLNVIGSPSGSEAGI